MANIRRNLLFQSSIYKIINPVLDIAVLHNSHLSLQEDNTNEMEIMHKLATGVIKPPPV